MNGDAAVRMGRGTVVAWLAWLGAKAFQLVALVLLTQTLPAEDLGGLLAALAAGVLGATLALGGLGDATTRQASAGAQEGFGRGDLRRATRRFVAVLPVVMFAIAGIAAQSSGDLNWSLLAAGIMLAVTQGVTTILASVFRARGQAGRFALATGLITNVGRAAVAALALAVDLGAGVVLWVFVALNVVVIAGTWAQAARDLPDTESAGEGDAALHLGGAGWSLLANLDVIVVGLLLGADLAGTYGALMRIAEFSSQFLVAISVLYLPEATRLAVAHRREALTLLYRTACRWSAVTSLLIAGTGFIAAGQIGELLFPDEPVAATLLRVLFVGYGIHGAMGSNYGTLVAQGAYTPIKRCAVALLVLVPSVTVAFCAVWGVRGAAWATATCYVVLNVYLTAQVRHTLGVLPFDRLYWRAVGACAAAWLVAAMVVRTLDHQSSTAVLIAAGAAAGVVCVILVPLFGAISARELDLLRRLRGSSAADGSVTP